MTIIYVNNKSNPIEPLTITIKMTNLGDTILVLTSNLTISLSIIRPYDSGYYMNKLWYKDDLKLKPNKYFIYNIKLNSHNQLIKTEGFPPVLLGVHKIRLVLLKYVGLNPWGIPSWDRMKEVEVYLNILARTIEFRERTLEFVDPSILLMRAIIIGLVIGVFILWLLEWRR